MFLVYNDQFMENVLHFTHFIKLTNELSVPIYYVTLCLGNNCCKLLVAVCSFIYQVVLAREQQSGVL